MLELPGLSMDIAIPTEDGRWVSESHERIARIIQDYDPELFLAYVPPNERQPGETAPFAVIHQPNVGPSYVVATFADCDERILEHLWTIDNKHGDVLTRMDAHNAALEAIKLKKKMDEAEERQDLISHIIKSKKNVYKHNGVEYRDSPR